MGKNLSLLLFLSALLTTVFFLTISLASDTLIPTQSITDAQTLISSGGFFELGFFTPGNSNNRYLGIWYKKISISNRTVVWVANRENPITDSSGVLKITDGGVLVVGNRSEGLIWSSSNSSGVTAQNPVAQLLDTGNLVVKDDDHASPDNFLWQSFDYPTDTLLPEMKLGWNLTTGLNRFISSWKNSDDPSRGDYSYRVDPRGFPQVFMWKGSNVLYRAGSWTGAGFTGTPELKPNPVYRFTFITNKDEVYYMYELTNSSVVSRLIINPIGLLQRFTWNDRTNDWVPFLTLQIDYCYALCGVYGSCNTNNSPVCGCLNGFKPKSQIDWDRADWSGGCIRKTPLDCRNGSGSDGFVKFQGMKLPDTSRSWVNKIMNLKECEVKCLKNCSCSAYANSDITGGGSGCLMWFEDLIDIRKFPDGEGGQDLYIRMAASEIAQGGNIDSKGHSNEKKRVTIIVTTTLLVTGMILLGLLRFLQMKRRKEAKTQGNTEDSQDNQQTDETHREDVELPLFDFVTIANATNNFSTNNKLGEGGFGPVYMGKLVDGQEIAVKRLSKHSGQGLKEFKNEVILIAKLQHRNLVKLFGCCIQGEEKMLIYEYMPNKSLDYFIFDQTRITVLDWQRRYRIINGIARGLLYLHQDSRLRIIHRDLKASNILLDNDMNPKISDFGMARIFGGDQTEAKTRRVVGTYGYMPPEYAIDGFFSVKTDVFSFGVLVLEIVSGKKNRGFYHSDHNLNLLGHAWRLWTEGRPLELIDALMGESCGVSEPLRCMHVGLLCVQQHPEDRPNMSSVVLMLGSESAILPQPKQPGFFTERNLIDKESTSSKKESVSVNEITVTLLDGR